MLACLDIATRKGKCAMSKVDDGRPQSIHLACSGGKRSHQTTMHYLINYSATHQGISCHFSACPRKQKLVPGNRWPPGRWGERSGREHTFSFKLTASSPLRMRKPAAFTVTTGRPIRSISTWKADGPPSSCAVNGPSEPNTCHPQSQRFETLFAIDNYLRTLFISIAMAPGPVPTNPRHLLYLQIPATLRGPMSSCCAVSCTASSLVESDKAFSVAGTVAR